MSMQTRRQYSQQFKVDAVRLIEEEGYSVAEVSRRLGVERSCVARWRREQRRGGAASTPARIDDGDPQGELRWLREENRKLRMERDILKKATAFFAKESN